MSTSRPVHRGRLRLSAKQRLTEYVYSDELLLRERRNLARRWWGTFGTFYGVTVLLLLLGWSQGGFGDLRHAPFLYPTLVILAMPPICALAGFLLWLLWINARPLKVLSFHFDGKPKTAFRVALACVAEAGWTPWEIDYDHQVVLAISPEGAYDWLPPQVVTIFCAPISEHLTEVRVQSRFAEATRVRDMDKVNTRNTKTVQNLYRRFATEAESPALPSPHPLARLKGKLPEEQELAIQVLGRARARARLWTIWTFVTVLAAVILHSQPWPNPAAGWPLTFLAAGIFHFLLGNQWNAQEQHALHHGNATVIANPYRRRSELWEALEMLARSQRLHLHEVIDEDTRLYRERLPAMGYPGTYLLFHCTRNEAGVEQLVAAAVPEWGLLSALMPQVHAPFQLLGFMQALRRGPSAEERMLVPELAHRGAGAI